jgi:hypothetical protein
MKFQASVVLELKAGSIAEAGRTLDEILDRAAAEHDVTAQVVDLRTPPAEISAAPQVFLPPPPSREPGPGPRAEKTSPAARPGTQASATR